MVVSDPYETLGVGRDASTADIERAYRKKSLNHHPDRGGDVEEFKRVSEARELLVNPEDRKRYDETGERGSGVKYGPESLIAGMLAEAFEQDYASPIQWMLEKLDAKRSSTRSGIKGLEKGRDKLKSRIYQFEKENAETKNTEARDFILENLRSGLRDIVRALAAANEDLQLTDDSMSFLDNLKMNNLNQNASDLFSRPAGFRWYGLDRAPTGPGNWQ